MRHINYSALTILFTLSILSAILLAVLPFHNQLYFYFDQARDAFEAYSIWHGHHLKLLGPATDIDGVFHGALWYYFLAIPYAIGRNNILFTGYFILFFSIITIPLTWYLTSQLFKDKRIVGIATLLYAFSPLFQISSRWISNPVLSLFVTPLLLIFFWRCITRTKASDFLYLGLSYGLLVQSNTAYLFFFIPLILIFIFFRIRVSMRQLLFFCFGLGITLSTFVLAEIKFHGRGIKALLNYFHAPTGASHNVSTLPVTLYNKTIDLFSLSFLSLPRTLIMLLLVVTFIVVLRKNMRRMLYGDRKPLIFLSLWTSTLLFFLFFNTGISRSSFVFLPMLLPICMLGGYFLVRIGKLPIVIAGITLLFVIGQINTSISWIRDSKNILTVQNAMTYATEQKVIKRTYQLAKSQPFSVNTITVPLYIDTTWAYLYEFYGKKTYGYEPHWTGRNQTGNLGELPTTSTTLQTTFLIIEPTQGIAPTFVHDELLDENNRSAIVREEHIGTYTLQIRKTKFSK